MPVVKINHVISFSSEDHNFPAENITRSETFKKWKCKLPGEKQATVILQLEKATVISSIDIGNEHSAFVEVLVGRSGATADDFQVLLVASSFMSPLEARNGTPANRVRMFSKEHLSKPAVDEKWDQVKIVCTQPFNKGVQYGLSFLTIHSPEVQEENSSHTTLGRFIVEEDTEVIPVGSLFAKRKETKEPTLTAAAAIRKASQPSSFGEDDEKTTKIVDSRVKNESETSSTSNIPKKARTKPTEKENSRADETCPRESHKAKKPDIDLKVKAHTSKDRDTPSTKKEKPLKRASNHESPLPKKKHKTSAKTSRKVFEKLLDGVVFVLSGYQNPLRATLRDKAIEMGAKYKPDWTSGCTHLICAFPNTPKFLQVKGKGSIVSHKWITESHSQRKRLPWRRFGLDRSDQGEDESEEEICEDVSQPVSDDDEVRTTEDGRGCDSGSGTDEDIERVKLESLRELEAMNVVEAKRVVEEKELEVKMAVKAKKAVDREVVKAKEELEAKRAVKAKKAVEDRESEAKRAVEEKRVVKAKKAVEDREAVEVKEVEDDPYGGDTDVDSDHECLKENRPDTTNIPLPILPDFYEGKTFYVHPELDSDAKKSLSRYITAFKGSVASSMSSHIDFVLAESGTDVKTIETGNPKCVAVTPDWVWRCNDAEKLLSTITYEI